MVCVAWRMVAGIGRAAEENVQFRQPYIGYCHTCTRMSCTRLLSGFRGVTVELSKGRLLLPDHKAVLSRTRVLRLGSRHAMKPSLTLQVRFAECGRPSGHFTHAARQL